MIRASSPIRALRLVAANFALACVLLLPASVTAEPPTISQGYPIPANIDSLADRPEWRALLHCFPLVGTSCNSRITSSSFFLAPDGSSNPLSELVATLENFYSPPAALAAKCRYPARYEWLKANLGADMPPLPTPSCPQFDDWMEALNPAGITLIFPSSFINNPASAFGHTLLRIDQPGQNEDTRLLAYTANFAANTQGEAALLYAFKGVFGGYEGYFSVAPYYDKVTKYSDLENRDIWEYQLNFQPSEVQQIVRHIYELRDIAFSYYYFDENCSYQLLSLLEVARPDLNLSHQLNLWVIPVDTIRALLERKDLVRKTVFRPSLATKLRHELADSSEVLTLLAKDFANQKLPIDTAALEKLSPTEQAKVLDLAYDILIYTRIRERLDDAESRERGWVLLSLRSKLAITDSSLAKIPTPSIRPEMGHGTMKLSAGVGEEDGLFFSQYRFRSAFHDHLDQTPGYLPGAQIKFVDLVLRSDNQEHLSVDQFNFFDIESFSARDRFFRSLSWNVSLGSQREHIAKKDWAHVWSLQAGAGFTNPIPGSDLAYSLIEGELQTSSAIDTATAFGLGPRLGFVSSITNSWAIEGEVLFRYFGIGDEHTKFQASLMQRVSLSPQFALRFGAQTLKHLGDTSNRGSIELEFFALPVW